MELNQGSTIEATQDIRWKPARGRSVVVKAGQQFWVTNPKHQHEKGVMINRKGKGTTGSGWRLDIEDILKFFKVID